MSVIFSILNDLHSGSLCAIKSLFAIFLTAFFEVIIMDNYF